MSIKTFKGLLPDNGKARIRLSTKDGLIGYNLKKLQLFANAPGATSFELVAKVFTVDPPATNAIINFDDPTLIAACYYADSSSVGSTEANQTVVIDNVKFNQDIFITLVDVNSTASGNYYIELEQVKLDITESTVATLKDMRGRE